MTRSTLCICAHDVEVGNALRTKRAPRRHAPLIPAGESYAGIYIPMLSYNIYQYNVANPGNAINLKGIMVGNGCIGLAAGHCGNDPTGLNDYHGAS